MKRKKEKARSEEREKGNGNGMDRKERKWNREGKGWVSEDR